MILGLAHACITDPEPRRNWIRVMKLQDPAQIGEIETTELSEAERGAAASVLEQVRDLRNSMAVR